MVDLNVYGLWPFAVGLIGWTLAIVVFLARPDRWQNRFVALALFTEPFLISYGAGWTLMVEDPGKVYGLIFASKILEPAFMLGYLGFLATLQTPLSKPLRHTSAPWIGGLAATLYLSVFFVWPGSVVSDLVPGESVPWVLEAGPYQAIGQLLFVTVFLYALAVTVSAWRRSERTSPLRERNGWFAAAFGVRDLGVSVALVLVAVSNLGGTDLGMLTLLADMLIPLAPLVAFLLLGYGILKTQLFDIDLKIKWTLEKSTVAAIFVAVFFIASEGAQVLFADVAGNEILGVLAAGALVFFLAPLQRFADEVGDRVMPGVEDTAEYRAQRKETIYRAQLEELMADEQVTSKERRALLRLQESLGLDGNTASRLEREMLGASGGEA